MNQFKSALFLGLGLGVVLGAGIFMALRGQPVQAQASISQPTWTVQAASMTVPWAWKLNTRTGELQFCAHNGSIGPTFCERLPDPK